MLCGNEVMRALHVSVFVHMCVLNVWHCETEQAMFAVRDWLRAGHQEQPAVYTRGQRLHMEEKCFTTPGQITFNIYWHSFFLSPSIKTTGQQLLFFFTSICFYLSHYVHPYIIPSVPLLTPSLSLPSAQSYHTGSLFLANLSLIHYWDLFFFLESQNEEKGTDLLNF